MYAVASYAACLLWRLSVCVFCTTDVHWWLFADQRPFDTFMLRGLERSSPLSKQDQIVHMVK